MTPSGVIVQWPDTDPASAFTKANDPYGAPTFLPFQEGKELNVTTDDEFSRPNNPGQQILASSGSESDVGPVSSDEPSREGETEEDCQLRRELNRARAFPRRRLLARNLNRNFDEEGVFKSTAANIMSAVRLLDKATPSIEQAKDRLEAAAIQVDHFDGSFSASKRQCSSSRHQAPSSKR